MSATAPTQSPTPDPPSEEFDGPAANLGKVELINRLNGWFEEAQRARESGSEARDITWKANHDAYWGRYNTEHKAEWQAREHMPIVMTTVNRYSAGMRGALARSDDWHSIDDPADPTGAMGNNMNKFAKLLLAHSGRNASGHDIGFPPTFADIAKSGALAASVAHVSIENGRVRVGAIDAREIFLDPKGRGLYRIRRYEVDHWQLVALKDETDSDGKKIWDIRAINRLQAFINEEAVTERETSSGSSEEGGHRVRKPIVLKEYLCSILNEKGELVKENQLVVMANDREIIRGPEDNPFWHGQDWILYMAPVQVPFSVYGQSYVESFAPTANTFIELTNLLIDATFASSISAHMVWVDALDKPAQLQNGIAPGVTYVADEEWPPGADFIKEVPVGTFPAQAVGIRAALKDEVREASFINDLGLGQLPGKSDITATEIQASGAGSGAMALALAADYDQRFLGPLLELVFWTGIQHYDPETDPDLATELGDDISNMIVLQRDTIRERTFKFTAFGITAAVDRAQRLQKLTGFLQILGQSEVLAAAFAQGHSIPRLIEELMKDFDIDPTRLEKTEAEQRQDEQRQAQAAALAQATGEGPPGQSGIATPSAQPPGGAIG